MIKWSEFLLPYEMAVEELKNKFKRIRDEYRKNNEHSPIEFVVGRVKQIPSIIEKARKLGITEENLDQMDDIGGIRIICQFVEDIDTVVELIRNRKDMTVLEETNYIAHSKESGYRSYHMIVLYPVYTVLGQKAVRAEIQIRTLGMNFWSTIEHSLSYKYRGTLPEDVTERLKNAAEAAFAMDQEMSVIRSEIVDAQGKFQTKAKLVGDVMHRKRCCAWSKTMRSRVSGISAPSSTPSPNIIRFSNWRRTKVFLYIEKETERSKL